nr:uracil phosphoribosyltransferase [Tanacetum cinerariifolium]
MRKANLYEDHICHKCSSICSFLHLYPLTIWASGKEHAATPSKENDVVKLGVSSFGERSDVEGGMIIADIGFVKERGVDSPHIKVVSVVTCPPALQKLIEKYPG